MAPVGTLWGKPHQPQTKAIRSVAALSDVELVVPEYHFFNKPAEFTAKFAYGKIPAFEAADGFKLIEGATIARYLSGLGTKPSLLGSTAEEQILVDQWVHFVEHEIGVNSHNYMFIVYGFIQPFNRDVLKAHAERLDRGVNHVEAHLATRPSGYLVSDSITIADLFLAGKVLDASELALGEAERAKYPNVYAHYDRVTGDERIKDIWGRQTFTAVAVTEPKQFPHT